MARRCLAREIFWLLLIALIAAGVIWFDHTGTLHRLALQQKSSPMLFVGDVMLARNVETLMDALANNHTYDHGKDAYENTRKTLTAAGLTIGGNPQEISPDEVIYHIIDDVRVAIIPVNTIGSAPSLTRITTVLTDAVKKSDAQIVFIHWGTEYELVANERQRALARALIDAGADAIIGHHPHVVQNIEEYRGAPIFYSLGNTIVDQYWNTDVRVGLAVAVSFGEKKANYTLLPLTSIDAQSAPRPMNRVERLQFLDTLAERSEPSLKDAIKDGVITELFVRSKNI